MSFKQAISKKFSRASAGAAAVPLNAGAMEDSYWGSVTRMDDVPLSNMRNMEPDSGNRQSGGSVSTLSIFGHFKHHLKDWLVIIFCIILDAVLNVIHPYYRFVGQDNIDEVKLPFKGQTVPLWAVPIIAIVIPLCVFLAFFAKRGDVRDLHQAVLGLLTAVGVTAVITDALKDGVGRARPDFFWRCFPDGVAQYSSPYGEVVCTGVSKTIREGHKSFPSGHSSWSFAGLTYLSLYLAGKVTFFDRRGYSWRVLFVFFPMLLAAMVAVSRVSNYWHFWQDVTVGGLLGFFIACFSYRQHFPGFADQMASRPYPHIHRDKPQVPLARSNPVEWGPASQQPAARTFDVETGRM